MEINKSSGVQIVLQFDPNESEELIREKQWLLDKKGLSLNITLNGDKNSLEQLCSVTGILQMTQDDLYFQDPTTRSSVDLTPQTHMKSLMSVKKRLQLLISTQPLDDKQTQILDQHLTHVYEQCNQFVAQSAGTPIKILDTHFDPRTERFIKWAQQNGIFPDMTLAEFPLTGRGMYCERDLKCDEIVFTLPERLIVTVEVALKCSKLGNLFSELKSQQLIDDEGVLMMFVINETFNNPESVWRPYLDILPRKEELPVGFYFDDEELRELDGLTVLQEIHWNKSQFAQYFSEWQPIFGKYPDQFPPSVFTFDNYLWVRVIFDSRSFSFKKFKHCLLPVIDMMNTHPHAQIETRGFWNEQLCALQFRMLGDYAKGKELHLCYGPFSNRELLLYYGFVTPNNCYDKFPISFEAADDSVTPAKRELLKYFGLSLEHYLKKDILAPKLLATLRIIAATEDELRHLAETKNPFIMINASNEERVLVALEDTAADLLNTINSVHNYSDEDQLLSDDSLPLKKRLAIMYRKEIKSILEDTLRLIEMRSMINALLGK